MQTDTCIINEENYKVIMYSCPQISYNNNYSINISRYSMLFLLFKKQGMVESVNHEKKFVFSVRKYKIFQFLFVLMLNEIMPRFGENQQRVNIIMTSILKFFRSGYHTYTHLTLEKLSKFFGFKSKKNILFLVWKIRLSCTIYHEKT